MIYEKDNGHRARQDVRRLFRLGYLADTAVFALTWNLHNGEPAADVFFHLHF